MSFIDSRKFDLSPRRKILTIVTSLFLFLMCSRKQNFMQIRSAFLLPIVYSTVFFTVFRLPRHHIDIDEKDAVPCLFEVMEIKCNRKRKDLINSFV